MLHSSAANNKKLGVNPSPPEGFEALLVVVVRIIMFILIMLDWFIKGGKAAAGY